MVSTDAAREHLRRSADGKPDRWRTRAAPRAADSNSIWLARLVLRLRLDRRVLGARLVRVVSRLSIGEVRCEPVRAGGAVWRIGNSSAWISMARRPALGDRNGNPGYGVLLRVRLHVLP